MEEVLASLYLIADDKRVALRGRMKHFQRMGFPARINTGKGVPAKFSFNRLMQLVFAFELVQSGLDPSAAKTVISEHWYDMSRAAARAMVSDADVRHDPLGFASCRLVFAFYIDGLHALQEADSPEYYGALRIIAENRIREALDYENSNDDWLVSSPWRVLLISPLQLMHRVCQRLRFLGFTDMHELFNDMAEGEPEWEAPYQLELKEDAFRGYP